MQLEWDERKNQINRRKHGLSFADAAELFRGPILKALDDREDYGEERWVGVGMIRARVVVAVYTERDDETIRMISLRKALKHERAHYEEILRDRLGTP